MQSPMPNNSKMAKQPDPQKGHADHYTMGELAVRPENLGPYHTIYIVIRSATMPYTGMREIISIIPLMVDHEGNNGIR